MSQYGFYREVQLSPSLQAEVLVDSNGRLILHVEDDVTWALVWNVESGIIDVNSEGRYNTQLAEWIANFGEAQYSYMFNETNNYTIIADSDEEDIQFDDATGTWSPVVTEVPGIPTAPLYYQEVQQVYRIVDSNGRLLVFKAGTSLLHLIRRMNEETYYWDGQPLEMEKTLPLEYVSGEQTYLVGDYTIYQSQGQQMTITPEPTEFTS